MNVPELERKLIAAARSRAPGDHVPLAFEKRILARLKSLPVTDLGALWAGALWRAAAPCAAIMVLLAAWSAFLAPTAPATDLSQDFENTVFAAVDQDQPVDNIW
jgi:hypothetical protein